MVAEPTLCRRHIGWGTWWGTLKYCCGEALAQNNSGKNKTKGKAKNGCATQGRWGSANQGIDNGDVGVHLDGAIVEEGWGVAPLANGVEGRLVEEWIA